VHAVAVARRHLQDQLNTIDRRRSARVARRFAAHLAIEFPAVFTFVTAPAPSATT
jgi:hypothetical protein